MADPIDPDALKMLAGEFALRVLEGPELVGARSRMLSDPQFVADVDWWQARFGTLSEQVEQVEPSPRVWQAIVTRLDGIGGNDDVVPLRQGPSGWSIALALGGLGAAAAAIALYIATPAVITAPGPVPGQSGGATGQLIAQLEAENGSVRLASIVDAGSRRLSVNVAGLQPAEGEASELWIIPEGGAPVSLGLIPRDGKLARDLNAVEARLMRAGATIAVTYEEAEGAPHATPTMPIVVAGALGEV